MVSTPRISSVVTYRIGVVGFIGVSLRSFYQTFPGMIMARGAVVRPAFDLRRFVEYLCRAAAPA